MSAPPLGAAAAVAFRLHLGAALGAEVPPWADRVARWQQLDPASAAIAEAWHAWGAASGGGALTPDVFILASQAASNAADVRFARSGAVSPAKFVSTLPSVTLSAMLQVTGWVGPMLCLAAGPRTLLAALDEAALLWRSGVAARIGVVSLASPLPDPSGGPAVAVGYFLVGAGAPDAPQLRLRGRAEGGAPPGSDDGLWRWLGAPAGEAYPVAAALELARDP